MRLKLEEKRNKEKGNWFVRYIKSFGHAIDGIVYTIFKEHNMIIIVLAIIVTTILGFLLKISNNEWLFIITMYGLVMGSELINSSIEALVDLATDKYHPLAKISKDTASSATLVFSITALIGALIIFIPKL